MNNGGPAFPGEVWDWDKDIGEWYRSAPNESGISKLDYFAAMAMQGLLHKYPRKDGGTFELAWEIAGDMLAESERRSDGKT